MSEPRVGREAPDASQDPGTDLVIARFSGEIATKSRVTRGRFMQRLTANVAAALHTEGIAGEVSTTRNRIEVCSPDARTEDVVSRVFGVQSVSRVEARAREDVDEILARAARRFGDRLAGRRFAVRARRVGGREPGALSARQLEIVLGRALLPLAAGVDLEHPEVTIHVELCEGRAAIFSARREGPGGLPLGVEGRALALVSGGYDSAVAAWQMWRRGVALDFLFCNLGGAGHQLDALRVLKALVARWGYGDRPLVHAIDFSPVMLALREHTHMRFWQILLKRSMLRVATRLAPDRHGLALVTGDAVGQVSSQTLQNLAVIGRATELAILRPLVGFHKQEILALARRIGTHDLSSAVEEHCAMVPRRPATQASLGKIEREEAKLEPDLIDRTAAMAETFDPSAMRLELLERPMLESDGLPAGATLIDLRSKAAFDAWHHPDALHLDFTQALHAFRSFEPGRRYVLFCDFGLKSTHLAERMQSLGFDAHALRGGLRRMMELANVDPELVRL